MSIPMRICFREVTNDHTQLEAVPGSNSQRVRKLSRDNSWDRRCSLTKTLSLLMGCKYQEDRALGALIRKDSIDLWGIQCK